MPRSDVQSGLSRAIYNLVRKTSRAIKYTSEGEYAEARDEVVDMLFRQLPPTRKLKQAYDKWLD